MSAAPQAQREIENLLISIEMGIPLNQLYLDLTSEKQLENDTLVSEYEIEIILRGLLEQITTSTGKAELLDQLAVTDPFVGFPEIIKRCKEEYQ